MMETDFISRKDAKDKHCEICEHLNICYQYDGDDCHTYTGRTCIERQCFNSIPAADVRPVVRGKWMWIEDNAYHICSNCAGVMNYDPEKGFFIFNTLPNFCPNCGADMREVNNDKR